MCKQTEVNRQQKEAEGRAKQRQEDYEDRLMRMFEQTTKLLVKEQQSMKDEN